MSDAASLAFSFHTPTFFVEVRISWNSWPLFSCWLRSCDVGLRLGSRVCVFVLLLFCLLRDENSTVDILLSTPWFIQRTGDWKTSSVLERRWSLWTESGIPTSGFKDLYFSSICHEDRHDWSYMSLFVVYERQSFEFGSYDIVHEFREMNFGWWFIIYHCVCHWSSFDHGCDLELWTLLVFSSYNIVMWSWWDAMSKGGMEICHPVGAPFG